MNLLMANLKRDLDVGDGTSPLPRHDEECEVTQGTPNSNFSESKKKKKDA